MNDFELTITELEPFKEHLGTLPKAPPWVGEQQSSQDGQPGRISMIISICWREMGPDDIHMCADIPAVPRGEVTNVQYSLEACLFLNLFKRSL